MYNPVLDHILNLEQCSMQGYDLTILVIITIMFMWLVELISKTQIHKLLLSSLVYF